MSKLLAIVTSSISINWNVSLSCLWLVTFSGYMSITSTIITSSSSRPVTTYVRVLPIIRRIIISPVVIDGWSTTIIIRVTTVVIIVVFTISILRSRVNSSQQILKLFQYLFIVFLNELLHISWSFINYFDTLI